MALGISVARKRVDRAEGFDQLQHLRRRHQNRGASAEKRAFRTIAYMKENGIEITSDPASKWLQLQRKARDQGGGITGMTLSAAFKVNEKEVTGRKPRIRGRMPHRGPAPPSGRI